LLNKRKILQKKAPNNETNAFVITADQKRFFSFVVGIRLSSIRNSNFNGDLRIIVIENYFPKCRPRSQLPKLLKSYPYFSSVLRPSKHLNKCLGLLRSRSDPICICKIKEDKTSTSKQGPFNAIVTNFLAVCLKSVCK